MLQTMLHMNVFNIHYCFRWRYRIKEEEESCQMLSNQFARPVILKLFNLFTSSFSVLDTLLQGDELKVLVTQLTSTLGTEATEQACEAECHQLIKQDHFLQYGCPLVCRRY